MGRDTGLGIPEIQQTHSLLSFKTSEELTISGAFNGLTPHTLLIFTSPTGNSKVWANLSIATKPCTFNSQVVRKYRLRYIRILFPWTQRKKKRRIWGIAPKSSSDLPQI